jgi:hypothetical protein
MPGIDQAVYGLPELAEEPGVGANGTSYSSGFHT